MDVGYLGRYVFEIPASIDKILSFFLPNHPQHAIRELRSIRDLDVIFLSPCSSPDSIPSLPAKEEFVTTVYIHLNPKED